MPVRSESKAENRQRLMEIVEVVRRHDRGDRAERGAGGSGVRGQQLAGCSNTTVFAGVGGGDDERRRSGLVHGLAVSAFAFGGEDMQKTLLEEEGVEFDESGRVDLQKYQWRT